MGKNHASQYANFGSLQLQGQEGGLSQVFMRFAGHHSKSL